LSRNLYPNWEIRTKGRFQPEQHAFCVVVPPPSSACNMHWFQNKFVSSPSREASSTVAPVALAAASRVHIVMGPYLTTHQPHQPRRTEVATHSRVPSRVLHNFY
jgi:hypothetical protein